MKHHDQVKAAANRGMRQKVLHMADGGPVSPFSLRGMANAIGGAASAVAAPFQRPAGYVPALQAPAPVAAPPVAAPQPQTQLGGMNLGAIQRREAAAGMRDGGDVRERARPGMVRGPGTTTSDSVPVNLSKQEYVLPADTTAHVGKENLDALVDATHEPVEQRHSMRVGHLAGGGSGADAFDNMRRAVAPGVPDALGAPNPTTWTADRLGAAPQTGSMPATPADPAFHGDGRYGAPANPTSPGSMRAPTAQTAPTAAAKTSFLDADVGRAASRAGNSMMRGAASIGRSVLSGTGRLLTPVGLGLQAVQTANTSTDDYAHRMGVDPGQDGVGSMAKDVGIRAVGTLADMGNNATFGLAGRVGNYLAGNGFSSGDSSVSAAPTTMRAQPSTQVTPNVQTDAQRGGGGVPEVPAGTDLGGGMRRFDGSSAPLFTNVAGTDNDRLMARGAPSAQNLGAMDGIQGRQDAHDAAGAAKMKYDQEVADAAATNAQAGGGGGGSLRAQLSKGKLTAEGARIALGLDQVDAQRETNRLGHQVTMRGQDLSYDSSMAGHLGTLANARARMQYDMNKDARDYSAGRGDKAFEQEREGQKAFSDRVGKMFVDPATGKPDETKAAEYTQFAMHGIADMKDRLIAQGKNAEANKLSLGRLDDADHAAIARQWANREAARSANGWAPGSGGFRDSLHPKDWEERGVDSRTVGGDHVVFNNGSHASINDLRQSPWYMPGASGTSNMDETIRRAQQARTSMRSQ